MGSKGSLCCAMAKTLVVPRLLIESVESYKQVRTKRLKLLVFVVSIQVCAISNRKIVVAVNHPLQAR